MLDERVDIYAKETENLGYNLADYYLFSKVHYQLPLVYRTFLWEAYACVAGAACFFIPFWIYGYGVANGSGKIEGTFGIAFAAYQSNVLIHHMQMFVSIRNYSTFFAITCPISIAFLWPIMILVANYGIADSENLKNHLGEVVWDSFFLQASSVVLSTFIVVAPIYIFKFFKMRVYYP
jgi:hypothetical protein